MKSTKSIILTGLFTYFLLLPFFFHPDLKIIFYLTSFLKEGVFNIYSYIANNPDKAYLGPFVYPPLTYLLFGLLFFPINALAGKDFTIWLAMGNDAVNFPLIFRYLFLMKLPLVAIHFLSGLLLTQLTEDKHKKLLLLLWFFNPISIYIIVLMGQIDGIPAMLTLLSIFLLKAKKQTWSAVALGLGGVLKTYPLLLLPFLAITAKRNKKGQLLLFGIGFLAYFLLIAPFLGSQAFYQNTLASGLSQRIFQAAIDLGFGEKFLLVPALLIFLFLHAYSKNKGNPESTTNYFLAVLLALLAGTHFHPQWTIWVLPFLLLFTTKHKAWLELTLFVLAWTGIILFFDDKFLTLGLASPMDPGILFLPTLPALIKASFDPSLVQSIAHTILSAVSIWIIWRAISNKEHE